MAKGPKFQISFLNSIQLCRPKNPSSLFESPLPALTYLSTTYDISLPTFPDPPSSPNYHPSTNCNVDSSKITQLIGSATQSNPSIMHETNDKFSNLTTRKNDRENLYKHPFSSTEMRARPITSSKSNKIKEMSTAKNQKAKVDTGISLAGKDETAESLSSPPPNFMNSYRDFNNPSGITSEEEPLKNISKKSVKQRSVRTQRFKRYGSKEWKDGNMTEPENESREQKPISAGRLERCMVDRKVNHQSFVVVKKRSVDPYEDFKKSMLEMIMEKQIPEPKDLEQQLMSFLSLNSRMHHKAILKAFTEIWKEVFSGSLS